MARQGNSGSKDGELEPAMEAHFTSDLLHSVNGQMGRQSRDETLVPANIIELIRVSTRATFRPPARGFAPDESGSNMDAAPKSESNFLDNLCAALRRAET